MNLKAYDRYKPSGIGWLGDLPAHWDTKPMRRLGEAIIGLTYSPENVVEENEGMLVLRSSNLQDGRITRDDNVFVNAAVPDDLRTKAGDILICSRNGSRDLVGKCARVFPSDAGLTFGAFTTVFRSDHSDFLFYVLNSSLFSFQAGLYQTSTIYQLTTGTLNAMIVPIPPKIEQRAIVDFLEQQTARLDTLVGKKRGLIEKLKEKRTALISRTVTRGLPPDAARAAGLNPHPKFKPSGIEWLGDIPENWEVKKLNWLFRYSKGPNAAMLTKEYVGSNTGDFPVFSGQTEDEGLMGMIDTYEFDFPAAVIFVTTVGARAMTTRRVSGRFSLSQNCALIIPRTKRTSVGYYSGVLRRLFDFERRSISLIMQPSLRFEDLNKFRVPLPPSTEQRAIADYLDRETAKIGRMIEKVEAAIEKLQEYRTALITSAVTGKVDVRNSARAVDPSHHTH